MIKNPLLVFLLLLVSSLTQHNTYAGAWREHLADIKLKEDEIPARIQNILDNQKDKFTKIEHYYPWEYDEPLPNESVWYDIGLWAFILPLVIVLSIWLMFEEVTVATIWDAIWYVSRVISGIAMIVFFAYHFYLAIISIPQLEEIYQENKEAWYQKTKNPGCFCLTDTALLIISPGADSAYDHWIPYEDILFITRYNVEGDARCSYLSICLKKEDTERIETCSTGNMDYEAYEELYKHLYHKVKKTIHKKIFS